MLFSILLLGLLSMGLGASSPNYDVPRNTSQNRDLTDKKTFYVDVSIHGDFSDPYIYYFNGYPNNASLSKLDNDLYTFDVPNSVFSDAEYGFQICDGNSYGSEWINCDSKLSQSGYNYILLSTGPSIEEYGFYGVKEDTPGATYEYQRVWLNNDNPYFYENNCINAVGYEYEGVYHIIKMSKVISERDYYYADIPYQLSSVHFLRVSSNSNNYIVYMDTFISSLAYGVCYSVDTSSLDDFNNIHTYIAQKANVDLLAYVVEAYLTYGKSPSNGTVQTTVQYLFKTWFRYKSATKDQMKNKQILDYTGYAANHNSYEGLIKNQYFSVNEKWNTMCSQVGVDPNSGEARSAFLNLDAKTWKIIGVVGGGLIILAGGTTFLFIYKKKKSNN